MSNLDQKSALSIARSVLTNDDGVSVLIDPVSKSLVTVDYGHAEIHEGCHFFNKDWVDLANGATIDFLLITPDLPKYAHLVFEIATEAEANVSLYSDPFVTANGTALLVVNRNANSNNPNTTLLYKAPTVTGVGLNFANYKSGSGKLSGGTARASNEVVLKRNTKYLLRVTNATTSNNWVDWLVDWYENGDES